MYYTRARVKDVDGSEMTMACTLKHVVQANESSQQDCGEKKVHKY